jgi:hypothetical protein
LTADATHQEPLSWRRFPSSSSGNDTASRQSAGDVFPAKSVSRQPDDRRPSVDSRLVGQPEAAKLRRSTVDGWQVDKRSDHPVRPDQQQRKLNGNDDGERRRSADNYLQTISHTTSKWKTSASGVSDRRMQQQTSVSTAFRAYSNLATACPDDDDDDGGRNRDDGKSESADDDDRDGSSRLNDTKSDNRSTTSSTVDEEERRRSLIKYSSLPNIYQPKLLRRLRRQLGADAAGQVVMRQQQHRHNSGAADGESCAPVARWATGASIGSSNVNGSEGPSTLSSSSPKSTATTSSGAGDAAALTSSGRRRDDQLERSSALFAASMPCISSACVAAGRGQTSRRYLPSLGIPEEVSELI